MDGEKRVLTGSKCFPKASEVGYYLRKRIAGMIDGHDLIAELSDIFTFDPWDLPALSKVGMRAPEWWFYSSCYKKLNSINGHWAEVRVDRIMENEVFVAKKKVMAFYKHKPKVSKTEWRIDKYFLLSGPQESFVLCRLWRWGKASNKPIINPYDESASSSSVADVISTPDDEQGQGNRGKEEVDEEQTRPYTV